MDCRCLAATAVIALPGAAQAAAVPVVSGETLTVTGDGAADHIVLRVVAPEKLQVDTGSGTDRLRPLDVSQDRDPVRWGR